MATKTAKGKREPAAAWSAAKRDAAAAARNYIKVGGSRGNLLLTGAAQKWKVDPTFTYVPFLRVAGTPADIERVASLYLPVAEVRQYIQQGFNAANAAGPLRAAYEAELAQVKASGKKGSKAKSAAVANIRAGVSLAEYAAMVEAAVAPAGAVRSRSPRARKGKRSLKAKSTKSKSPKAKSTRTRSKSPAKSPKGTRAKAAKATKAKAAKAKSPTKAKATRTRSKSPVKAKATRTKSKSPTKAKATRTRSKSPAKAKAAKAGKRGALPLADKIAKLSEGKVMDVSKLMADGSGAKTIKMPSESSAKVLVPGTRIVSDHKSGVTKAAKMLGDDTLVARWVAAQSGKASPRLPEFHQHELFLCP
jgi:histone H1/5